jgi:hypothetical protein
MRYRESYDQRKHSVIHGIFILGYRHNSNRRE